MTHIFYWLLSPDTSVVSPSMASHHVSDNFMHSSPSLAILGCICPFKQTKVQFIWHGLRIYLHINQGQGRGLGSSDRTLIGAGEKILSNLLHYK